MKENIETKDVQRTEYLDKNGLDMLWAKVKENTHNQVEVEYNRAKAKEDSLSQEIASIKPSEDKSYIQAKLTSKDQDSDNCYYDVAGQISFKSEYSDSYGGVINSIDKNGIDVTFDNDPTFGSTGKLKVGKYGNYNITMQGNGRLLHDTRDTFNEVSMQLLENADATYVNSMDGNSMLISQLGIFYTSQGYALTSNDLLTGHGDYKTIGTDIAPLENGKVPTAYLTAATKEKLGVVKVGDGLNVTDGTISVDTTAIGTGNYIPYARYEDDEYIMLNNICTERSGIKSRIGSNGLSVYKMTNEDIHSNIQCAEIELQSDKSRMRINENGIDIWKLDDFAVDGIANYLLGLSKDGVTLYDGDDNHVLTSNASTIDISQYALKTELPTVPTKVSQLQNDSEFIAKSVYDEKIAALESRIAALEAKHTETV